MRHALLLALLILIVMLGCSTREAPHTKTNHQTTSINTWRQHGYTKAQEEAWRSAGVNNVREADAWVHLAKQPKDASRFIKAGITSAYAASNWLSVNISSQIAPKWVALGITNAYDVAHINYDELVTELIRQKISLNDYKVWVAFGLIQPDDITFFLSKGYTIERIKGKDAQTLLNSMDNETFFKFMGITDRREINGYLIHWKFTTNFKRFRDIVHRHYSVP